MAIKIIVDPNKGLYQEPAEEGASSFDVEAGVTLNGFGGGGGVTVIVDGGTLTGTYEGDVLCKGSATLAGNVTVEGKLTVLNNLINDSAYELIVRGDLIVNNDFLFDHTDPTAVQSNVTVDGNFTIKGYYLRFKQGGESEATLRIGGNFISSNGFTGTEINAYGNDNTAGLDIIVYGDMSGFSAVNIYGGPATSGGQGGFGGDLEVYGSYTGQGHVNMYGGNGLTFGNGGNGGNFHCHGDIALGDYDINMYGGDAEDYNGGNGGNFTCDGNISVEDLDLYGGNVTVVSTGGSGGSGGNLNVNGDFNASNDVDLHGGNGGGSAFTGGNGGVISIDGNFIVEADVINNGGDCVDGSAAGNGGEIYVFIDMSAGSISTRGGFGTNSSAGNGGNVEVEGSITLNEYGGTFDTYGGDCISTNKANTAGNGGNIICNTLNWPDSQSGLDQGTINTNAGSRTGVTVSAGAGSSGASAGNITVNGNMVVGTLSMNGSNITTTYKSFTGGNGGTLIVGGNLMIQTYAEINGGDSDGFDGGNAGSVSVAGTTHCRGSISLIGGDSNNSAEGDLAGTNGYPQNCDFDGGASIEEIQFKDGSGPGAAPSTNSILRLGSNCFIQRIDATDRAGIKIQPSNNYPALLKVNEMVTKNTLNKSDGTATGAITLPIVQIYVTGYNGLSTVTSWYIFTGSELT